MEVVNNNPSVGCCLIKLRDTQQQTQAVRLFSGHCDPEQSPEMFTKTQKYQCNKVRFKMSWIKKLLNIKRKLKYLPYIQTKAVSNQFRTDFYIL